MKQQEYINKEPHSHGNMKLEELKQQTNSQSSYIKYNQSLKGRAYSLWLWLLGLGIRIKLRNEIKVNYNSEDSATVTFNI